jgi:hypothetical protein
MHLGLVVTSTLPYQSYDALLGSDVLYEKASILTLTRVLKVYLCNEGGDEALKRALIRRFYQCGKP